METTDIEDEMNEEQVRIRYAIGTDAQSIIELLVELDRPLPKDRKEKRKFRMLIASYIDSNFTESNRGIIEQRSSIMRWITKPLWIIVRNHEVQSARICNIIFHSPR